MNMELEDYEAFTTKCEEDIEYFDQNFDILSEEENLMLGIENYVSRTKDVNTFQRYQDRWYKTMSLNLDFINIPPIIDQLTDSVLNTPELKKQFLCLNKTNNKKFMQLKVLATIKPILLSLFVAWKSGEWCVRYSRGPKYLSTIKSFFYLLGSSNKQKNVIPGLENYFIAWNRKTYLRLLIILKLKAILNR